MIAKTIKLWSDEKDFLRTILTQTRNTYEPNDEQRKPYDMLLERLEQSKMSVVKAGSFCHVTLAGGAYEICINVLSKSDANLAQKLQKKLINAPSTPSWRL